MNDISQALKNIPGVIHVSVKTVFSRWYGVDVVRVQARTADREVSSTYFPDKIPAVEEIVSSFQKRLAGESGTDKRDLGSVY